MRTHGGNRMVRVVITSGVLLVLANTAAAHGRRDLSDAPRHTAKVIRAAVGPGVGKNTQELLPTFAGPAKRAGSKGASRVARWLAQARQGDWNAFQSLLGSPSLGSTQAEELVAATSVLEDPTRQGKVLEALVDKVPIATLLAGVNKIPLNNDHWGGDLAKRQVLLPLARENLSRPDAVAVAENADLLAWVPERRAELLKTLGGKAPLAAILSAVERIPVNRANWSGESARRAVLLALARREDLSGSDAAVLARRSDLLGTAPNWQAELLENLLGRTQLSALRAGVDAIPTTTPAGRAARSRMMLQLGQIGSNGARSPN